MHDTLTTITLGLLALLALTASVLAILRLRRESADGRTQHFLVWLVALGSAAVYLYQAFVVHNGWQPLRAHVDGLALMAALLGGMVLYLQRRPRLEALSAFALPLLTLLLAWSVCASAWTYNPFELETIHPVWTALHLACVYLGTLSAAMAAMAGGMFLYVQHRLRLKHDLRGLGKLASLETLETLIIRTATLGFALLTLALATGLVIVTAGPTRLGAAWWYSPKIALSTAAWVVYALVMNVRFATTFRGSRAAWLSIAGLVLLLATLGLVNALARESHAPSAQATASPLPEVP